jgi:N-dimethylarginine dimethylaminohydrolase
MKIDFEQEFAGDLVTRQRVRVAVSGETDRLTDVALASPRYLEAVPCCSVTRESLRKGFAPSVSAAQAQHAELRRVLESRGVACHSLPSVEGLPDQCFVRDVGVATPWGLTVLKPAKSHRAREADELASAARSWGASPARRITAGPIEGGDVCVARPGLLIVGVSGERTSAAGAEEFAAPFRAAGWEVIQYPFDPHFLHLDTVFCMFSPDRALACVEVLDDWFLEALAARGIEVLPVSYKQARRLGCNILSIDPRTVVASAATPEVTALIASAGLTVLEVELDQLTACGGGVHCLTLPLTRTFADRA